MRELLGELLLQAGQPAAALREFEGALQENPNRYHGLPGAGRAAEAAQGRGVLREARRAGRQGRHDTPGNRAGQDVPRPALSGRGARAL